MGIKETAHHNVGWISVTQDRVASSGEQSNETSGSITGGDFLSDC
jgi:hypothetical protein